MRPAVLALAAAQLAVPLGLLGVRWAHEGSRARTEYGASWQMYTTWPAPAYRGLDRSGSPVAVDASGLPPVVREVAVGRTVPDRLCRADPRLAVVVRLTGPDPGRFAC